MLDASLAHVLNHARLDEGLVETTVAIRSNRDLVLSARIELEGCKQLHNLIALELELVRRTLDLLSNRILPSLEMHGRTPCSKITTFSFFKPK